MTVKSRSTLSAAVATLYPDNIVGDISADDLRTGLLDIVDSAFNIVDDTEAGAIIGNTAQTYLIENEVDFTVAEPAHAADTIYLNTTTGAGSTTVGTTFNADELVVSDGAAWTQYTPALGWRTFNKANTTEKYFNGSAWVITGAVIAVDSVITNGSSNPVENNAIFDALALKLAAIDISIWKVESTVDFTTAEPAHSAGLAYVNTVTGAGSTTTGTTFNQHEIVVSDGANWTQYTPADGWKNYNKATNTDSTFTGAAWADSVLPDAALTYVHTFVIADFTSESLTVTEATHGLGTTPIVAVMSGASAPFTKVEVDTVSVAANGDITITVGVGLEFDGRLWIK